MNTAHSTTLGSLLSSMYQSPSKMSLLGPPANALPAESAIPALRDTAHANLMTRIPDPPNPN
jgi:hypothetical protein